MERIHFMSQQKKFFASIYRGGKLTTKSRYNVSDFSEVNCFFPIQDPCKLFFIGNKYTKDKV